MPSRATVLAVLACASALVVSGLAHADALEGATVSGVVKYSGRQPQPTMGQEFDATQLIDDPAARGLEFAFVYLEIVDAPLPAPPEEPLSVFMDQIGFRFAPLVLAAASGQLVVFGNADSTDHNIRGISEDAKNEFNIITRPGHTYEKRFAAQPLIAPLRLACDFHPNMQAWIYIVDGPWHAVTGPDGAFTIGPVAPGKYRLHVRDPNYRMSASTDLELAPGEAVSATITFGIPHRYYRAEPPIVIEPGASSEPAG